MTYFIVALSVLSRLAPHPANFSPVYGALLFGGARLKRRDSIWFPLALVAASNVILTTQVYHMRFSWTGLLQLPAFAAFALIGTWLRNRTSVSTVLAASLAGSTAFCLLSNFAVWLGWQRYPATWRGLLACYVAALPFFRNSLLSCLLFSVLLFGGEALYRRKFAGDKVYNPATRLN